MRCGPVRARVIVVSDSAVERRDLEARSGHFICVYTRACSYQVTSGRPAGFGWAGSPVAGSNGFPSRAASLRMTRNASARALAANDLQCSRPSTAHRTRWRPWAVSLIFLMSQNLAW